MLSFKVACDPPGKMVAAISSSVVLFDGDSGWEDGTVLVVMEWG